MIIAFLAPAPARAVMPSPAGVVSPYVRAALDAGVLDVPARSELRTSAAQADWLVPVILVNFPDTTLRHTAAQLQTALFDTTRFTRNLEAAYIAMWERQQRGEPPSSFAVERAMAPASS